MEEPGGGVTAQRHDSIPDRVLYAGYALAVLISVSIWFVAIRSPLWLDETISFWQIHAGFREIWARQGLWFPAYSYILWLASKVLGTSEVALRLPSVFAMLAAAYLLYRIAREFFERDVALIALIVFCLHPIVVFESIDARPYAFAVLATNAAILALVRMRHSDSNGSAALFGILAASILYFHYLFGVVLPALAVCFFIIKRNDRRALRRQLGVALAAFTLALLPIIPGLHYVFQTRSSRGFGPPPGISDLVWTLAPGWETLVLIGTALVVVLVAAVTKRRENQLIRFDNRIVLLCAALALIPVLTLYGVSVATSLEVFVSRYRLAAIPGIALCWALLVGKFDSRAIRLLFCVALATTTAYRYFSNPDHNHLDDTWKYALDVAQKNASRDNAPVLICSDVPDSDYAAMPLHSAGDSYFFPQLSYYKLTVPVVPLPRSLNQRAIRIVSSFLQKAARRRERFLALAFRPSYGSLDWISKQASGAYSVHNLGTLSGIRVLEFIPNSGTANPP